MLQMKPVGASRKGCRCHCGGGWKQKGISHTVILLVLHFFPKASWLAAFRSGPTVVLMTTALMHPAWRQLIPTLFHRSYRGVPRAGQIRDESSSDNQGDGIPPYIFFFLVTTAINSAVTFAAVGFYDEKNPNNCSNPIRSLVLTCLAEVDLLCYFSLITSNTHYSV